MPPKRRKPSQHVQSASQSRRGPARRSIRLENTVPNVYAEMLAEVAAKSEHDSKLDQRPVKRRKVIPEPNDHSDLNSEASMRTTPSLTGTGSGSKPQQVVYDDFEESEESDIEFEDVELEPVHNDAAVASEHEDQAPIEIDLSKPITSIRQSAVQRRKPVTKAERDFRLDVHKWHLLSLLVHGLERSRWCDDEVVHATLKPLVPRKTVKLLHVDETQPSFQRNHSFNKGIEEVCLLWRTAWNTTAQGLRRPYWREKVDAQLEFDRAEDPIDLDDFRSTANTREGSRDLGAQLFTALLRCLALDARLVFSLQVLPFAGVAKGQTPENPKASYIHAPSQSYESASSSNLGRRRIKDSPYPVFWTEVFNPITNAWIPLDPIVRNSINKPKTQFEPPASDNLNQMAYVLSYEDDLTVRDVTQRYAQWFNAKTRRLRVESTRDGVMWWNKALGRFRRKFPYTRDEIEDHFLAQRNAVEGMPKNVQDFKGHPVYVLERHIRANQVIHPRRESGKFSTGSGKNVKVESVFKTQDLHLCRSADAWYRRGRDVKIGQQPLKRAKPKIRDLQTADFDEDEEDADARDGVALYAEFQTRIYEPPPVTKNRIPKNAFGNLDIYVPTMIPAGAVHINHHLAGQAARVLGIDYADAVTGFVFRGRQGNAVISGVVVALEYTAAVVVTIESLEWLGTREVQTARSKIIAGIWKRMLTALRVHQKIEAEYGDGAKKDVDGATSERLGDDFESDEGDSTYVDTPADDGGGFMLEAEENDEKVEKQAVDLQALKSSLPVVLPDEVVQHPISITRSPHEALAQGVSMLDQKSTDIKDVQIDQDDLFEDGQSSPGSGGGFGTNESDPTLGVPTNEETEGGFIIEDVERGNVAHDLEGGGFIPDDDDPGPHSQGIKNFPMNDHGHNASGSAHPGSTTEARILDHPIDQSPKLSSNRTNQRKADGALISTSSPTPASNDINSDSGKDAKTTKHLHDNHQPGKPMDRVTPVRDDSIDDAASHGASDDNDDAISNNENNEDNEVSSLLSHDPDEDDDEPEWLDDALDD